jgi:hypothetical protein
MRVVLETRRRITMRKQSSSLVAVEYETPHVEELGAVESLTHGKDWGDPEHAEDITIVWGSHP